MHVVFAASECVPYVKTGGLADVVGALPREIARWATRPPSTSRTTSRCASRRRRSSRSSQHHHSFSVLQPFRRRFSTAACMMECSCTSSIARSCSTGESLYGTPSGEYGQLGALRSVLPRGARRLEAAGRSGSFSRPRLAGGVVAGLPAHALLLRSPLRNAGRC